MQKSQKVWLWIFGLMFLVPEILWSPVMDFIYSIFRKPVNGSVVMLRNSILFNYKYERLLGPVIFLQFVGALLFLFKWFNYKNSIRNEFLFWIVMIIGALACLASLFILYMMFTVQNMGF